MHNMYFAAFYAARLMRIYYITNTQSHTHSDILLDLNNMLKVP